LTNIEQLTLALEVLGELKTLCLKLQGSVPDVMRVVDLSEAIDRIDSVLDPDDEETTR
jgi:hypothetical protein